MGRSVNYLNNAEVVLYFNTEIEDSFEWSEMVQDLIVAIKSKLPSYYASINKWDNRETRIILDNKFCNIGISEYCGLVSLSVAPKEQTEYYSDNQYKQNFAIHHARQIEKTLQKCLDNLGLNRLNKLGTFSNGESIYQKAV